MAHDDFNSSSSSLWDWDSVLLLAHPAHASDDNASQHHRHQQQQTHGDGDEQQQRRRRDPRLSCPNFLAGRVPCACSDGEDEDEEERSKKRSKLTAARCQVPSCHADLTPLKGYHQRHRVCLTCANATSVVLRSHSQRYCQQCAKFHLLADFDEGKRSCRRKLERHNSRRRRKQPLPETSTRGQQEWDGAAAAAVDTAAPSNSFDASDVQQRLSPPAAAAADGLCCFGSHVMPPDSTLQSETLQQYVPRGDESLGSASGEQALLSMLLEQGDPKQHALSLSPIRRKHSTYTSPCPTRRIAFKFYDWNPADFPRRLREQILEWLANMPVELEGYIRSGCTILTLLIAMPESVWTKLDEDWNGCLVKLVTSAAPGFWDRGFVSAFLDSQVAFIHDGAVSSPSLCERASKNYPVIEEIFPPCVEVGTKATVTIIGHNLLKLNSRLLVSSQGKYLSCCIRPSNCYTSVQIDMVVPQTFGLAFVEIAYDHGISNFVPLLVADKELCHEIRTLDHEKISNLVCCSRQNVAKQETRAFLVDLGWVIGHLSLPIANNHQAIHIRRLEQLLKFSVEEGWCSVTHRILQVADALGHLNRVGVDNALQLAATHNKDNILKVLRRFKQKGEERHHEVAKHDNAKQSYLCKKNILKITMVLIVACAGICLVIQHPHQVFQISSSFRRCLWYKPTE